MPSKGVVIATVIVFTILGFLLQSNSPLGGMIWPPSADLPTPDGSLIPLFMLYGLIAAIGFGFGFAFLLFGKPLVARLGLAGGMATAVHLAVFWVLGNWVIHDSLHITNGHNLAGLIGIEFAFHATLILAGLILALGVLQVARRTGPPAAAPVKA